MSWKLTVIKEPDGRLDLLVQAMIKEIIEYSEWATYSEQFIDLFTRNLRDLKTNNAYMPCHLYKATPRNLHSLEVWQTKPNGDFVEKLWQIDFVKP